MAVRRLRIRRCYSLGLDGNLHLRGESLCVGFAYPNGNSNSNTNGDCHGHGDGYTYTYAETDAHAEISAYTKASPNAAASAVTLADSR
jgi:hypothetical protein